jgi:hypothetical protein
MAESEDNIPEPKEVFLDNFFQYMLNARSMIIDNHEPGDELNMFVTARRTESDRNVWDLIIEPKNEGGKESLLNTLAVGQFQDAQELTNEIADQIGFDFDSGNKPDSNRVPPQPPESPAFR